MDEQNKMRGADNNNAHFHYMRGNKFRDEGNFSDAIAEYTHAIESNPGYVEACYSRGTVFSDRVLWTGRCEDS